MEKNNIIICKDQNVIEEYLKECLQDLGEINPELKVRTIYTEVFSDYEEYNEAGFIDIHISKEEEAIETNIIIEYIETLDCNDYIEGKNDFDTIEDYLTKLVKINLDSIDDTQTLEEHRKTYIIIDYLICKIKDNILNTPIDLKKVC